MSVTSIIDGTVFKVIDGGRSEGDVIEVTLTLATATSERRDGFRRHWNLAQTGISGVQLFADCAAYGSEGAAANFWGSGSVVGIFPTSIPRPIRIM
jgi:hypothetical protein